MIDYWLEKAATKVTVEILDAKDQVVRSYSSDDTPFEPDPNRIPLPTYWLRKPSVLAITPGMHRWLWDMRRQPLQNTSGVPMTAILHDTPANPTGPWVPPGEYTVRLTVDGKSQTQKITVRIDPRVK